MGLTETMPLLGHRRRRRGTVASYLRIEGGSSRRAELNVADAGRDDSCAFYTVEGS